MNEWWIGEMEKRIALCIGNNNYQHMESLTCAINDADAMGAVLQRMGYETIIKHDLDRSQFGEVVFEFTEKIKDYDACVFYYAGHGFEIDSQNLLIPVDLNYSGLSRNQEIIYNAFTLNDLINELNKSPDVVKIIILDACRKVGNIRGNTSGFGAISAPKGSLIAFSTSPGEGALEDSTEKQHGKYTNVLLKYMECSLGIEAVFKRVRQEMNQLTNGRQIPWEHTSLMGDFYFDCTYSTKIAEINFIESVKIIPQRKRKEILIGDSHILKTVESVYPLIEADNPYVPRKSASIEVIQKHLDTIYESVYKEWEKWLRFSEEEVNSVLSSKDPFSDGVGYEVLFNQEGILCICIDRYLYAGGFHGMPSKVVKTFDLNSGIELRLQDLMIESDVDIVKLANERFMEEKIIHEKVRPIICPDFTLEGYHAVDDFKWYLDVEGIHIYFDIYEASSYSEGYINYLLTDHVSLERHGKRKELELINQNAKQKVIDELVTLFQDRYELLLHQVIGGIKYDVMAVGVPPINITTFWLIKCVKYMDYSSEQMEAYVFELIRMKKNYEVLVGTPVIAELYIVWDEEQESETMVESQNDFKASVVRHSDGNGLQFESKLRIELRRERDEITFMH